ncbi:carbohydrate ABC transporter permease, partial [Hungatella effluvii]
MKKKRLTYSNFYFYLLLLAPILAVYILFFVIPVVSSMFFSLTNFNGISLKFKWVGFNNYDVAFHDKVFKKAMVNTFLFALGATVLQNLFAIVFAMALNTKIKSRNFLR